MTVLLALIAAFGLWCLFWRPLTRAFARAWGRAVFGVGGVQFRHAPRFFKIPGFRGVRVTTFDRTVLLKYPAVSPMTIEHELRHVQQWDRLGWRFPFVYLWNHLRYGYGRNPLEVEAREGEA